ncbi:hypothetical protein JX265_006329 [Neoarthrinium moseri]|uniref:Arylsulfotransferase n=1 Tax=Neoarthrinium moseri TaxID=1658444 RepID=A0A9P9WMD7_9PEZI|nr:hypothetical protein JX265_006329 [Neoarthrinium moseri]
MQTTRFINAFAWLFLLSRACNGDKTYKSRPDLSPPQLNTTIPATSQVGDGYLFIAPYSWSGEGTPQSGPYILDDTGDLVWSGFAYIAPTTANFQPAVWKGQDVLFAYEGILNRFRGHGHGHHKILDKHYQTIREVRSAGHYLSDMHEFNIVDGKTVLVGSYTPREIDVTAYGGSENQTWVLEYILQEIDIETGDLIFEWHSLDHTSPKGSGAGSGHSSSTAWDYIHVNSIAKGDDGHYIASARAASTVYKINGTDGSILWRLGGKTSDFDLGPGVEFAFQHHARYVPGAPDTISLFDNSAGAGSAGKIIHLDFDKWEATLIQAFNPPHPILAFSQGSTQILPNGNALVNWGSANQVTEFSSHGEVLFHAFLESGTRQDDTQNYRAFKSNWTGFSPESPALVAEEDAEGRTAVWVSWNGDTRTTHWRIRWSSEDESSVMRSGKVIPRQAFETTLELPGKGPFSDIVAEALDATGNVIIVSESVELRRKFATSSTLKQSIESHLDTPPQISLGLATEL